MNKRVKQITTLCLLGFMLGTASAWYEVNKNRGAGYDVASIEPAAGQESAAGATGAEIGGDFSLVNHNGTPVTQADYADSYKLVFFGFTHCPEICPTNLQKMTTALESLGPVAQQVQPLFITTDPERDTPAVMKQYVEMYHPRLVGLTGTPEQIEDVKESYKVYAAKVEDPALSEYTINHSSFTFLMSPENEMLTLFSTQDSAADIAQEVSRIVQGS